jgi:MoaA/NifB/PqqE/SkfB family radical SAM enzyme
MFDHYKKSNITECQLYYTRKCNSRCGACNLPDSGEHLQDLSLEQWKTIFLNLHRLGIKTVKMLGGEPTETTNLADLLTLIRFIKDETDIKLALLSNSKWDKSRWFDKICDSGLFAYYASVDIVGRNEAICHDTLEKSQKGYKMLLDLKKNGKIPLLAANVVMSTKNLTQLPELITLLSEQDIFINLCPIQCITKIAKYDEKIIGYQFRKANNKFSFTEEHIPILQQVITELVTLQKQGAKIAVPADYILATPHLGLHGGTWQCKRLSQIRVDSDGTVMICNEFRGETSKLPNISTSIEDIDKWTTDFINYWYEERPKFDCQCYWSCFLQAEKNIDIGSAEFGFYDNPQLHGIGIV